MTVLSTAGLSWSWGVWEDSSTCCGGGWGWGEAISRKDRESFAVIFPAAFRSVYLQKKKKKKKKEVSFNLVGGPTLTHLFRHYSCNFCLFSQTFAPGSQWHGWSLTCVPWLLSAFWVISQSWSYSGFFKEREGRWLFDKLQARFQESPGPISV